MKHLQIELGKDFLRGSSWLDQIDLITRGWRNCSTSRWPRLLSFLSGALGTWVRAPFIFQLFSTAFSVEFQWFHGNARYTRGIRLQFSTSFLDSWTMVGWEGIALKRPAIGKFVMASLKVCTVGESWKNMLQLSDPTWLNYPAFSSQSQPILGSCEPAVSQLGCRWKLLSQRNCRNRSRSLHWARRTVGQVVEMPMTSQMGLL